MWKLTCWFALLAATPLLAQNSSQSAAEEARILNLENAWNQAQGQKDGSALRMLLGPELVYVDYDGKLMDKAEYLAKVQAPSLQPAKLVNESMHVQLYGAVAIVSGVCHETGVKNGKAYSVRMRFTDTWIRHSESWMCVASHSTLIDQ